MYFYLLVQFLLLTLFTFTFTILQFLRDFFFFIFSLVVLYNLKLLLLHSSIYNSMTTSYRWLIEILLEFDQDSRRAFLEFCTSCGRLPTGGLQALNLKILPEQPGRMLPRSRACANTLFLPDYPNKNEFERYLKLALHDSHGQFEQE